MALSQGKKRYSIALNQERYERFQAICKEIGAPRGTEGQAIDDFVRGVLVTLEHLVEVKKQQGKSPTFGDAMYAVSKAMKEIEDEQLPL